MYLPLANSGGWDFLIYLIVGVFWLIGNIMQQKRAKEKAAEMRRRREEREREEKRTGKKPKPHPLEQDLETFLGRLAGELDQTKPAAAPAPAPPPPPRKRKTVIHFDQKPPPPPVQVAPQTPEAPRVKAQDREMDTAFEEIEELKDAVEISYDDIESSIQEQTLKNVKQVKIDLSSMMLDMPRLPVQRMRSVHTHTTPPNLKTKQAFKNAVLSSIILGKPAALQDPNSDAS